MSLATDIILAARVALEAAEPPGVPVFPGLVYGIVPSFRAYPGTISLKIDTMLRLIGDKKLRLMAPDAARAYLGDGNFGGLYRRPDEEMLAIWKIAVDETRGLIESGWQ